MRVTTQHWEAFLNIAESHKELITNKCEGALGRQNLKRTWELVAATLNGLGYGLKTTDEWRRTVTDWKSKTKSKWAKLQAEQVATGGGENKKIFISEIEERLLNLMGRKAIVGDQVRELGIEETPSIKFQSNMNNIIIEYVDNDDIQEESNQANQIMEVISDETNKTFFNINSRKLCTPTSSNGSTIDKKISSTKGKKLLDPTTLENIHPKRLNMDSGNWKGTSSNSLNVPSTSFKSGNNEVKRTQHAKRQKSYSLRSNEDLKQHLQNMQTDTLAVLNDINTNIKSLSDNICRLIDSYELRNPITSDFSEN